MVPGPIDRVLWSIGGRFSFTEAELLSMPANRLRFWFRGHLAMIDEENAATAASGARHG